MSGAAGGTNNDGGGGNKPHIATPVPVLPAGQQTWFGRAIAWLKGEASTGLAALSDFVQHDALPFLETFLKQTALDEIKAITPYVKEAAQEFEAQLPTLFTEPGKFTGTVLAIARSTTQKVEAAGLNVAESSILTASQAELHNLLANAGA